MLTYKVKQNPKGGATLSAQLNNKGPWRKMRKFSNATHAVLMADMYKVLHNTDADAKLTVLLAQHPDVKLKVSNEECLKTLAKEEAKFEADMVLLNKPTKVVAVAATAPAVEQKTRKIAVKSNTECTYTVTGKDDSYHSKIKQGKPGNAYWAAFKNMSQVQSTYTSKDELITKLIIPAFQQSNLRSGNPSASDLRNMVAYLVREGCITV